MLGRLGRTETEMVLLTARPFEFVLLTDELGFETGSLREWGLLLRFVLGEDGFDAISDFFLEMKGEREKVDINFLVDNFPTLHKKLQQGTSLSKCQENIQKSIQLKRKLNKDGEDDLTECDTRIPTNNALKATCHSYGVLAKRLLFHMRFGYHGSTAKVDAFSHV